MHCLGHHLDLADRLRPLALHLHLHLHLHLVQLHGRVGRPPQLPPSQALSRPHPAPPQALHLHLHLHLVL